MGPGAGLIIGTPFVILTLALLSIWRRQRNHGPTTSRPWRLFYRGATIGLLGFVGYMVVALLVALTTAPPQ